MELFEAIHRHKTEFPDRPALLDETERILWGDLEETVDRTALGLVHNGMRRGKGVALLAGRSVQAALSLLSIMRGGGTAAPLPARLGIETLRRILRISRPLVLLYESRQSELAEELAGEYEFREIIRLGEAKGGELSMQALRDTAISGARFPVLHDTAVALHNYGLDPAGEVVCAAGTLKNLWYAATTAVRGLKLKDGSRVLSLFSSGLNTHESLLRAIRLGGAAVYCRGLHPENVCQALERFKVDCLTAPTPYYHVLCDHVEDNQTSVRQLRAMEARGHLPPGLAKRAKAVLGHELLATWGTVETFGPALGAVPTGFGAPAAPPQAFPGIQESIVNADGMEILGFDVGELCLSGESIAQQAIGPDGRAVDLLDNDKFWHTGLRARRHDSGEIQILGSRYDVVLRDGRRVYPRATADVLEGQPGIAEAAGVLMECGVGQFDLVMAVVLAKGAEFDQHRTMKQLSASLELEELPDDIVTLEALPRRVTGDIDMPRLQSMIAKVRFK